MSKIISILNNKGGVGKTITSVNLASILTLKGYKVLLIDMDQQANATQYLNAYGKSKYSINDVMFNQKVEILPIQIKDKTMHLIPSHSSFSNALTRLKMEEILSPQHFLKRALKDHLTLYDYVIIDCPPSLDSVTSNALNISTEAIIPMSPSEFALEGIGRVIDAIERVNSIYTEKMIKRFTILFTRVEKGTNINKHIQNEILAAHLPTFETSIRKSVKVIESETQKEPLNIYSPHSLVNKDYEKLANEIISQN